MPPRPLALLLAMAFALPPVGGAAPSVFPGTTETVVTSPDADVAVPRYTSVVSLLDVDLAGEVLDADVLLDLAHPNPGRLDLYLVAPDGRTVTLSTRNGRDAVDALAPVTFDDGAPLEAIGEEPAVARHVRNVTWTAGMPLGTVQPEGALGALTGTKARGPWALVILDDGYGDPGLLRSWSLRLTTLSGVPRGAPEASFAWRVALPLPDDQTALALPVEVTGLDTPVLDVDVDVSVTGIRGRDLDLFLTSPAGTRIELATDVGGDRTGLYDAVTFDDDAPDAVSDAPLPEDGSAHAFAAVVPEGALGAFLGESPAGDWTLEVADDGWGNDATLVSWTLRLVPVGECGNGVVDAGEDCDDGNGGSGDGCDADCRPSRCGNGLVGIDEECDDGNTADGDGCSSLCRLPELACDDCADNDGNGLADAADPGCRDIALTVKRAKLATNGKLLVKASGTELGALLEGPLTLVVSDAGGVPVCAVLPAPVQRGAVLVTEGAVGGGTVSVTLRQGRRTTLVVKGRDLGSAALDARSAGVGIAIDGWRLGGGAKRGPRR